jgi:uncharacterized protein (UPF0276 family)
MDFPHLGFGIGLRPKHYDEILSSHPAIDWFEAISENFMVAGGRPRHVLDRVREHYPVVLHGVSLSVGSTDPLDRDYLTQLGALVRRVQPAWISDHLCWTSVGGHTAHDLLPLPHTDEAVAHVVARVQQVQEILGRRILLENVSTYLEYTHSTIPEWEFLTAVAAGADCGILLDVNNIYVNARNHGFSPQTYLDAIPIDRVHQFHLAGHTDRGAFLHDTHDHAVADAVWDLYRAAVRRFGRVSTLIEWDDRIPALAAVHAEALRAAQLSATVTNVRPDTPHDPAIAVGADSRA